MTKTKEELTADDARQLLAQERAEREQRCMQEIQAVLDRHGCRLAAQLGWTGDGRATARVLVVSR